MAKKVTTVVASDGDIEVVSKPGMGIDEGIVFTTFFLLIGAIALVMIANKGYGA